MIRTKHLGKLRTDLQPQPWARSRNRRLDTALVRLRIGHCGLKNHLHRINLEESESCDWCNQPDTIEHFIFYCPRHHSARTELQSQLHARHIPFTLRNLLGGEDFSPQTNSLILKQFKVFLKRSERLGQILNRQETAIKATQK